MCYFGEALAAQGSTAEEMEERRREQHFWQKLTVRHPMGLLVLQLVLFAAEVPQFPDPHPKSLTTRSPSP